MGSKRNINKTEEDVDMCLCFVVSENNGVLMMTERIWRRSGEICIDCCFLDTLISLIGS